MKIKHLEGFRIKAPFLLIWKGSISNFWFKIGYSDREFLDLPSVSHVNGGTISSRPLPSKSFQVYY